MNWLNLFPLLQDEAFIGQMRKNKEELMSLWVPSGNISYISLGRLEKEGKYLVEISFFDGKDNYKQEFGVWEDAQDVWNKLQSSLGIKVGKKRGPKKRYHEQLEA